ncbi:MAG: hypothetical protein RLZZ422_170 [Pseudomonadota bacterium]|jgi:hypothetical protein
MMKTSLKMSIATGLAALLVSFGASAEKTFNIGGDAEYDITSGKTTFDNGWSSVKNTNEGGRVKLNAKARIDNPNGSFVEAVVQPLFSYTNGKNNATDDTYIKFGKKAWDVQLGRFEAVDLFPTGKDTVFTRATDDVVSTFKSELAAADPTLTDADLTSLSSLFGLGYQANKIRGRNSDDVIQGAAHFNVGKTQVELGAAYKDANGIKTTGIRPVVKFDAGRFRMAAGYDMLNIKDTAGNTDKTAGFGITAGTTVGTVKANVNYAQGKRKLNGTTLVGTMKSYGLNGERGRFGAGYIHDKTANLGKQDSLYAAYTVPLMGSKDATVTFAANTSKAKYDGGLTAKNNSLRARFNYAF